MHREEEIVMAVSNSLPIPQLLNMFRENRTDEMWLDYDASADVLYINFKRPIVADDSEMTEDNTIVRYHDGQVVGITILDASTR